MLQDCNEMIKSFLTMALATINELMLMLLERIYKAG